MIDRRSVVVCLAAVVAAWSAACPAGAAEVTFGPRHEMIVDGKLFLPVHCWATAMKDLDRLKGHGVNVALALGDCSMSWKPISEETVATTKKFLDELQRRDMYGVIVVSAWWSKPANRGIFKDRPLADYMALFKDHPALLGWQASSEDDMGLGRNARKAKGIEGWAARPAGTLEDLKKRYEKVKKADPKHPVVLMFSGGQMIAADRKFGWTVPTPEKWYFEASRHADILYHDLFPVANNTPEDLKQIADATDLLAKYSRGRKHLWVAVDAGDRKRWTTRSHAPTGKEIRNELWQAVVHGAHGLGFDYTSWKPTWASIRMSAEGEKGLTAALKEIEALKEPILLGHTAETLKVTSGGEGKVHAALRERGGKRYVFAVNVLNKPCTAEFALSGMKSGSAVVLGENRSVEVAEGKLSDVFEPYGVHLYQLER